MPWPIYLLRRPSAVRSASPTVRLLSQSCGVLKKQDRVRDHGFDNYMEVQKKVRKVLKFQELIQSQPGRTICVARLDSLARRLGFRQFEAGAFILRFPHIFEIYEHPVQRNLWCRLTRSACRQIAAESSAFAAQLPDAVLRLRKLLMMSNTGRLRLDHLRVARYDVGLPDDFEQSAILANPSLFRVCGSASGPKFVEIVDRDPELACCEIERLREREYRERGKDAESIRFSFIINFPPGFKISKYFKIAVWKWQRLPYWSPYEDVSGYDLRSLEAQRRMEKRAVATIHELLCLTVEKKITLERIAHFRNEFNLPKKLKDFLLQHQGIFYISTRGNHGKLHTIFLREAYRRGDLIEPNDLYMARRGLFDLILASPRKATMDRELCHFRRDREDDDGFRRYIDDSCRRDLGEEAPLVGFGSDLALSGGETSVSDEGGSMHFGFQGEGNLESIGEEKYDCESDSLSSEDCDYGEDGGSSKDGDSDEETAHDGSCDK
ncbi:unnamed protein product [Victoria cruziana]